MIDTEKAKDELGVDLTQYLPIKEAAEILGIQKNSLYYGYIYKNKLNKFKFGHNTYIKRSELKGIIENRGGHES